MPSAISCTFVPDWMLVIMVLSMSVEAAWAGVTGVQAGGN